MILNIVVAVNPEINAAGIEVFTAEAVAGIFGEMEDACFGFETGEFTAIHNVLAANGFDVARKVVNFNAAKPQVPFMPVDAFADEFYECHFVGVEKL